MKMVRQKNQICVAVISVFFLSCNGEIPLSDFKDTLAIFNAKAAPYHAVSPLFGRTLTSTMLLKNIYLYGNQTDALCKLLKELFYVHPHTNDFNITMLEGNIAHYFTPKIIGQLIQALTFSTQAANDLESTLVTIILNGLSGDDVKRMLKHVRWQQPKKEFDQKKKQELRNSLTQKAMSSATEFANLMKPYIEALKKKLLLPQETSEQVVLEKAFTQKEFIKGHIDNAVNEAIAQTYQQQGAQEYHALIKPDAVRIAQLLIQSRNEDAHKYITFLTQRTVLVFLCLKGNNRNDLKIYFDQLDPALFHAPFDPAKQGYTQDEYYNLQKMVENQSTINDSFFSSLLSDTQRYEQFLFVGMAALIYEKDLPSPVPYIESLYRGHYFFNCGEAALRSFLNIIFQKVGSDAYDATVIDRKAKAPLKQFYQKHTLPSLARSADAHNDWNNVVSNIDNVKYVRALKNNKEINVLGGATTKDGYDAVYEINSGLANIITVLRYLCNLPTTEQYIIDNQITIYNDTFSIAVTSGQTSTRKQPHSKNKPNPLKEKKNALLAALVADLSSSEKAISKATLSDDNHSFTFSVTVNNDEYDYEYSIKEDKHAALEELSVAVLVWRDTLWEHVLSQDTKTLQTHIHTIVALQEAYAPENVVGKSSIIAKQTAALGQSPLAFLCIGQYPLPLDSESESLVGVVAQANSTVNGCLYNMMTALFKTGDPYEIEIGENMARAFLHSIHDSSIKRYIDSLITILISNTEKPIIISEQFFTKLLAANPNSELLWVDYATKLYTNKNTQRQGISLFRQLTKIKSGAGIKQFLKLLYTEPLPLSRYTLSPGVTDMDIIGNIMDKILKEGNSESYGNELMTLIDKATGSTQMLSDFGVTLIKKVYLNNTSQFSAIDPIIKKNLSTLGSQSLTNPNEQKRLLDVYQELTNAVFTYLNHDFDKLALQYLQLLIQNNVPRSAMITTLLSNLLIERYGPTLTELINTLVLYLFLFSSDMQEKIENTLVNNINSIITSTDEKFKKPFYESFMQYAVNFSKQQNSVLTLASATVLATTLERMGAQGISQNEAPAMIALLKRTGSATNGETLKQVMEIAHKLYSTNLVTRTEYDDLLTGLAANQTIQNSPQLLQSLEKFQKYTN